MIPQNIMDELLAEQDRQIKILKDGIYQKVIAEKDRQIKIQNDRIQDLQYLVGLYRRMYGSKKKGPSSACKGKVVLFSSYKKSSYEN